MTAADRMRQSRQRRKDGGGLAKIDLNAASIARLIALRRLLENRRRDRATLCTLHLRR